jgi:hypothetical protein
MLIIGTDHLVPVLLWSQLLKCLLHLLASHFALATNLPAEINLVLFTAAVCGNRITIVVPGQRWMAECLSPTLPHTSHGIQNQFVR